MNPVEVSKSLPLKKLVVMSDAERRGHYYYYECHNPADAELRSFEYVAHRGGVPSFEQALYEGTGLFLHGPQAIRLPMDGAARYVPYPAAIVNFIDLEEGVRGLNSDYSDPENDIVKTGKIKVGIRYNDKDEKQTYTTFYGGHAPFYGVAKAYRTMVEMQERILPSRSDIANIVAFEYRGRVLSDPTFFQDDLEVVGTVVGGDTAGLIDPDWDDDDDGRLNVSYLDEFVFFQKSNEIHRVGNAFYMNGAVLFTVEDLMRRFPDADEYSIRENGFYRCEYILDWIRKSFPQAVSIDQGGLGGHWMRFGGK